MKAVKLLVKIAVMMVSPSFLFFLDLLPRWEKGFPSGPCSPWHGRGESPSEIGYISLSLSVYAFSNSALAPFLLYPEIRNSNWIETFGQIFFQKLAFLWPKKGINRLIRGPGGCGARPPGVGVGPCLVATSGTVSC